MPPTIIAGDISTKDPQELSQTLKAVGISRIDTAARYQTGESERKIGASKLPQDFTIDTKILYAPPGEGTLSAAAIDKSLSNSLAVLREGRVNILYCHAPDYGTPLAEQAKAFDSQHQKGRFSHLGVSNFEPEMLQEWLSIAEKEGYVKPTVYQGH